MSESADARSTDVAIIGGGIVGLATAYQLLRQYPGRRVVVLEKEARVGQHQTGHNSGVLHTGIYYKPGSLRAINCRAGKLAMEEFCRTENIPYQICGKVIVAIDQSEIPALDRIFDRGKQNGVRCEMIDAARLAQLEPHAAGIKAIHVPEAGIVDYKAVCQRLSEIVTASGGRIIMQAKVTRMLPHDQGRVVHYTGQGAGSASGEFHAKLIVNCAGLHCDRVTKLSGQRPSAKIVPFRGEYFELKPEAHHLVKSLIYPVPDPNFPFLGVHFTRIVGGGVECGPNAVLAFAREGYRKRDINLRDLFESLAYRGFQRLAFKYWRTGMGEMWRSFSKRAFVKALSRLVPDIRREHLVRVPAGVRAQAVSPDGSMVDDFLIQETDGVVNVGNAPSPAATASLNIGKLIVEKIAMRW